MGEHELYPLSQTQQLNLWSRMFTIHKQVNNIATSALAESPLDLGGLRRAAEEGIERNDSFGVRIVKRGKQVMQYFGERRALVLETRDFTGRTDAAMQAFFEKVARKPLPLYESPLAKVFVVRAPDGATGLFTCVSHLAMDTWAIHLFYRDVFQIYFARVESVPLPEPILPFEELVKIEMEYEASQRREQDREFWRQEVASYGGRLPGYTNVNGTRSRDLWRKVIRKPDHPFGWSVFLRTTARHEVMGIERGDLDAMAAFCEEQRVSLQVLFLVALRTYLARVGGKVDDVTMSLTLARRGTLVEKKSGGDRATGLIFRTIVPHDATFLDALKQVARKQNSVLRHADLNYLEVRQIEWEAYGIKPYEEFGPATFAFQAISLDVGHGVSLRTEWYCSGTSQMQVYVMVMGGGADGSLRIIYEYRNKHIRVADLRRCHAFMLDVIGAGIRNPDITMAELLELPLLKE